MTKETPMEETKGCCEKCYRSYGGGQTMLPLVRSCANLDCDCHKLHNKEDCGEIFCKKCGLPKSTWGTIPYPYPPCSHEVGISSSDKTLEEKIRGFVAFYPTTFNGKPFMIPVGWTEKLVEDLIRHIKPELTSATIKANELNEKHRKEQYQLGYKHGYEQGRFDMGADKEFNLEDK